MYYGLSWVHARLYLRSVNIYIYLGTLTIFVFYWVFKTVRIVILLFREHILLYVSVASKKVRNMRVKHKIDNVANSLSCNVLGGWQIIVYGIAKQSKGMYSFLHPRAAKRITLLLLRLLHLQFEISKYIIYIILPNQPKPAHLQMLRLLPSSKTAKKGIKPQKNITHIICLVAASPNNWTAHPKSPKSTIHAW